MLVCDMTIASVAAPMPFPTLYAGLLVDIALEQCQPLVIRQRLIELLVVENPMTVADRTQPSCVAVLGWKRSPTGSLWPGLLLPSPL